ncbi:hypothetical protein [uncultured Rikenella sp.]|uniref:hypothetical protein n=1 Tax=uncultured Rikenella sp. TaxID=368003 RepID=UPI0025E0CE1F|nr:hypothetical protein [uncultured Rikenella sp.]
MRRMIFLLLSIFSMTAVQAQEKVTLVECGGDTVTYVKRNFAEGKARFIGQPFSKLVEEWRTQIPVGRILFSDTGNWPTKDEDKYLVTGASLYFITEEEMNLRVMKKQPYASISVDFAPPYRHNFYDLCRIEEEDGLPLGPKLYECLKDYIVTDVSFFMMKW